MLQKLVRLLKRTTAVRPKIPHSNCCKIVPNRPLRGRRGRFGTLLQLLECGIFGRTAVRLEPMVIQLSARGTPTHCAHTFLCTAVLKCAVGVLQADGTESRVWRCSNVSLWSLGRNSQNSAPAVTFMSRHQTARRSSESSSHVQARLSRGASLMYSPVQWEAPPQLYNFNLHGGYL